MLWSNNKAISKSAVPSNVNFMGFFSFSVKYLFELNYCRKKSRVFLKGVLEKTDKHVCFICLNKTR